MEAKVAAAVHRVNRLLEKICDITYIPVSIIFATGRLLLCDAPSVVCHNSSVTIPRFSGCDSNHATLGRIAL